jgi:hypothetical protein
VLTEPSYVARYLIAVPAGGALLVGFAAQAIVERVDVPVLSRRAIAIALAVVVAVVGVGQSWSFVGATYRVHDLKAMTAYLNQHASAGDEIVLVPDGLDAGLAYYSRDPSVRTDLISRLDADQYPDFEVRAVKSTGPLRSRLAPLAPAVHVWVLDWREPQGLAEVRQKLNGEGCHLKTAPPPGPVPAGIDVSVDDCSS